MLADAPNEPLNAENFEALRDSLALAARRMDEAQILELADYLHSVLRHRGLQARDDAQQGAAGFP